MNDDELKAVQEIFVKLSVIYGTWAWESFIGKEFENIVVAKGEWWKELKKYSDDEIGYALAVCRKRVNAEGQAYPPKLPEFINFCQYIRNRKNNKNNFHNALPKPAADIKKAESEVNKMMLILKRPKKYA